MLAAMSARPPAEPEPSPARRRRRRRLSLDRRCRRRRRLATGEGEGRGGDTEGGGCARPQRRPSDAERAREAGEQRGGRGAGLRGTGTPGATRVSTPGPGSVQGPGWGQRIGHCERLSPFALVTCPPWDRFSLPAAVVSPPPRGHPSPPLLLSV